MLGEEVRLPRAGSSPSPGRPSRDPDGTTFDRDVVRHPGAVAVVAVTDTAIGRARAPVPAGRSTGGSSRSRPAPATSRASRELTAAHRELGEEVGYAASDMALLTRCAITPGFCDERSAVYLATGLTPVALDRQGIEERHMTIEEVPLARSTGSSTTGRSSMPPPSWGSDWLHGA